MRSKKSPKSRPIECNSTGIPLTHIAFKAAHPDWDVSFEDLDPANRGIWERVAEAIAAAVREKDAAQIRKAA